MHSQAFEWRHCAYFFWNNSTQVIIPQVQSLQLYKSSNLFRNGTREIVLVEYTEWEPEPQQSIRIGIGIENP